MRDFFYGVLIAVILWAIINQWKRNKDTVKTVLLCLSVGVLFLIVLLMIWKKATIGRFY